MSEREGGTPPEQARPLLTERNGVKTLRQLSNIELGIQPNTTIITPEGFVIRGQNDPARIRRLTELTLLQEDGTLASSPTSLDILDIRLRPLTQEQKNAFSKALGSPIGRTEEQIQRASKIPAGYTEKGVIAADESFTELVATATETTTGLKVTNQQLADFLLYFDDALKIAAQSGQTPDVFEFNGRTFAHSREVRVMSNPSPLQDGTVHAIRETITCLDDGTQVTTNHSKTATWINRYGFYGGGEDGLDPKKIAIVAGFAPMPENDPVKKLVQDPNAEATITTRDQLARIKNLAKTRRAADVLTYPNYTVTPDTTDTLITYVHQLGRNIPEGIIRRLNTTELQPQTLTIDQKNQSVVIDGLLKIPQQLPEIAEPVLSAITAIEFSQDSDITEAMVDSILRKSVQDGPTNNEYLGALLGKMKGPEMLTLLYDQAYKSYRSAVTRYGTEENEEVFTKLQETIDTGMPNLRSTLIATLAQEGFDTSEELTTKDLIRKKPQIDTHRADVQKLVKLASTATDSPVTTGQMGSVFNVVRRSQIPDAQVSEQDAQILSQAGTEAGLLPYAKRSAKTDATKDIISALYNGNAARERTIEQTINQLPSNMDESVRQAAITLIRREVRTSTTRPDFVPHFLASLQEAANNKATQQEQVDEADVLKSYVEEVSPTFADLLNSEYITMRFEPQHTGVGAPIGVTLNEEALTQLPEVNRQKTIQIGDVTYTIIYPLPESRPIFQEPITIRNDQPGYNELRVDKKSGLIPLY